MECRLRGDGPAAAAMPLLAYADDTLPASDATDVTDRAEASERNRPAPVRTPPAVDGGCTTTEPTLLLEPPTSFRRTLFGMWRTGALGSGKLCSEAFLESIPGGSGQTGATSSGVVPTLAARAASDALSHASVDGSACSLRSWWLNARRL